MKVICWHWTKANDITLELVRILRNLISCVELCLNSNFNVLCLPNIILTDWRMNKRFYYVKKVKHTYVVIKKPF
jgi:hypothetical protein